MVRDLKIIKLAPLLNLLQYSSLRKICKVVCTSQHGDLIEEQLRFWNIEVDYFLPALPKGTGLTKLLSHTLSGLQDIVEEHTGLQYILVQGDTNTSLACSHIAFFNHLKLLHVEAGLRSFDLSSPFPEEFNRSMASKIAYFHFAPTDLSKKNLMNEKIPETKILVTGNTIVDAISFIQNENKNSGISLRYRVMITLHRRETSETDYLNLLNSVMELGKINPLLTFTWITHPNYSENLVSTLKSRRNLEIVSHLRYKDFVTLYDSTRLVITDSGGVCEESIQLGIPLIVFRKLSERTESLSFGHPMVITMEKEEILKFFEENIGRDAKSYFSYGDGNASLTIFNWLKNETRFSR